MIKNGKEACDNCEKIFRKNTGVMRMGRSSYHYDCWKNFKGLSNE